MSLRREVRRRPTVVDKFVICIVVSVDAIVIPVDIVSTTPIIVVAFLLWNSVSEIYLMTIGRSIALAMTVLIHEAFDPIVEFTPL